MSKVRIIQQKQFDPKKELKVLENRLKIENLEYVRDSRIASWKPNVYIPKYKLLLFFSLSVHNNKSMYYQKYRMLKKGFKCLLFTFSDLESEAIKVWTQVKELTLEKP